ncbi:radical SAM protein [Patescibacteria group bacterium]|nr:radical SAM protein [Patescibacteria group bacterium]
MEFLRELGYEGPRPQRLEDIVVVRNPAEFNFGRASYEITEGCNYRCLHCYLGEKAGRELSFSDKKRVLGLIRESGIFWLQITGGEPLASRDFIESYLFACSMGLLITISTNGSLLTKPDVSRILSAYPPYRVTISMYGATTSSYEALTQVPGSFRKFSEGLEWIKKSGIRTRLNIIVTRHNEGEIGAMKDWAESLGFEHYVFSNLSPTLEGSSHPLTIASQSCEKTVENGRSPVSGLVETTKCMAGETFFHVNSAGRTSICNVAREPSINLLERGIESFRQLPGIAEQLLKPPSLCQDCKFADVCVTCPPMLSLHRGNKVVPSSVCKRLSIIQ